MIEYWQGFEIDGSDTNYNLVVPEKEKCIELLNNYLNLKIIHKAVPVKVNRVKGKGASLIQNTLYEHEQLNELWDIIRTAEIKSIELEYTYVAPNSLYPEVKRELIDTLVKLGNFKANFENPCFNEPYHISDYIFVNFENKSEDYSYDNACSETYFKMVSKTSPYINIDFNCRLGGPHALMVFGMSKIKDAFPEFEIDLKQNTELISWYDIKYEELILEGIIVESTNYSHTLERILSSSMTEQKGNRKINLRRLPEGIENFDPSNFFEYDGGFSQHNYWDRKGFERFKVLKGIFKKRELDLDEYIRAVEKMAKADIFTDADFEYYTSFHQEICIENVNYYYTVKFYRDKKSPKMLLLLPWKHRDKIRKHLWV